jgi:hypothetical protein
MNSAVVVKHIVKSNRVAVIVGLLGKSVRQSRESAHVHPHRKVLALYVTGAHMLGIGIAAHNFHIAANAGCWRIARLVLNYGTVDFLEHRVINIRAESILNRV